MKHRWSWRLHGCFGIIDYCANPSLPACHCTHSFPSTSHVEELQNATVSRCNHPNMYIMPAENQKSSICPFITSLVSLRKWQNSCTGQLLHLSVPAVRFLYLKLWLPLMWRANAVIHFISVFSSMSITLLLSLQSNGEQSNEFSLKTNIVLCIIL